MIGSDIDYANYTDSVVVFSLRNGTINEHDINDQPVFLFVIAATIFVIIVALSICKSLYEDDDD